MGTLRRARGPEGTTPRRRRRAVLTWLAAAASAASVIILGPTAQADTQICGQYQSLSVSGGQYIVQNDEWNDSIQQCLNVTNDGFQVTSGSHNLSTSGSPAAYPSIYAGCHYGNCTSGNGLPLQVSAFGNPQSSVNFSTASGQWTPHTTSGSTPSPTRPGRTTGRS